MNQSPRCWCGNTDLVTFSPNYLKCLACETLVAAQMPGPEIAQVLDDERDFYGHEYWFSHQERDLGLPTILARSRTDLPERCLYWLWTVLKYKLPSARVLELGSGHGGFVAMLRSVGFDATGLEVSPWVVEFARKTFNVPMLLGSVEVQQIEPASLDMIALMDVLEHLPEPLGTMRHCLSLLKPDGILVIQTPQYPESKTYEGMVSVGDCFLVMLQEREHSYLFSQRAIREFFSRLDADHVQFEPAIFAPYSNNMFLVVSRAPLVVNPPAELEKALSATPGGRVIQALRDLEQRLEASEADRAARLVSIEQLEARVRDVEEAAQARLVQVERLGALLTESEADRAARLVVIERQGEHLQRLEAECTTLQGHLAAVRQQVETKERQLAAAEQDRAVRLAKIEDQAKRIAALELDRHNLQSQMDRLRFALETIRAGRVYRLMRRLGRWGWLEQVISQSLPLASPDNVSNTEELNHRGTASNSATQLTRIVVDLTPLLPGGENGGAKLMATELVRQLSRLLPRCEFVLLTSEKSHDELAILDSANVSRLCVSPRERTYDSVSPSLRQISTALHEKLAPLLPASAFTGLKSAYRSVRHRQRQKGRLKEIGADLLFCPFTAPFFYDPSVPTVSVIYDLQYLDYPEFFSSDERYSRDRYFKEACRLADRLVCISEYVRGTVLTNSDLSSDRVAAIHPRLFNRLQRQEPQNTIEALKRRSLLEHNFLLYPANFWLHKNHRVLFTAFGMYRARHPESELKLVCTGAPDKRTEDLREAAQRMGLGGWIVLAGYLSDEEFAALLQSCLAVIFPSLYEGFGMPLLEAMAFGKPVLCSNVTSLPEVAGDAALYFDPRRPQEIVSAIERIATDPELVTHLVECGYRRLATFGGPEQMAQQYLHVFRELMAKPRSFTEALQGVYPDGWTGQRVVVTYSADSGLRHMEMLLQAPTWLPHDYVSVAVLTDGSGPPAVHVIARGQSTIVRQVLPNNSGYVECVIEPTFQPKTLGLNDDERILGCLCQTCQIISTGATHDLLDERG